MFLALREMRRARTRFLLLIAAIGLLVFLILTQQAIQNGLITAFVGAIERQSAPVLVFSVDGQRTLQGSVIAPALERRIRAVPGIAGAGRIGQSTFTVRVNGRTADSDSAMIGYDRADLGAPDALSAGRLPRARGEAVGSEPRLRARRPCAGDRRRRHARAAADRRRAGGGRPAAGHSDPVRRAGPTTSHRARCEPRRGRRPARARWACARSEASPPPRSPRA